MDEKFEKKFDNVDRVMEMMMEEFQNLNDKFDKQFTESDARFEHLDTEVRYMRQMITEILERLKDLEDRRQQCRLC